MSGKEVMRYCVKSTEEIINDTAKDLVVAMMVKSCVEVEEGRLKRFVGARQVNNN